MEENEKMLSRLQDQSSHYNVYDWELDRKESVKRVKAICYYPPTMMKKKGRKGKYARAKSTRIDINEPEPNRKLFDLYQESIRKSNDLGHDPSRASANFSKAMPMGDEMNSDFGDTTG